MSLYPCDSCRKLFPEDALHEGEGGISLCDDCARRERPETKAERVALWVVIALTLAALSAPFWMGD
ncbi:hypothetical protein [Albimonas pacifica]|uniref:Uncharacterized protein n=1 Tax=Albimonas pacifica TaxID=1114924 RepID=A0A1I3FVL2_9RHOB|nr:hypothetical protein [Albimonas pacifica]SFI15187.1 hypothetical protein SAMN05216258_104543 [Albimonas pacifica]